MKSPYPYFGGKSKVAPLVWERFGDVRNYVEPFVGSNAMLLSRPDWHTPQIETINDADGMVSNFWRAVTADPEAVARHADWPVNENDLHARHIWLVGKRDDLHARLEGDAEYYDAKIAGWWVWGIASWIGSGWCSGRGPWSAVDGELAKGGRGFGVERKPPELHTQKGIKRQRPHLGDSGRGIRRQRPHLGNGGANGQGVNAISDLHQYMVDLQERMRRVRVASGDWSRVVGKSVTHRLGETAVFLDPPYEDGVRASRLYAVDEKETGKEKSTSTAVREWAIANGDNLKMKIALCGYDIEHEEFMPDNWEMVEWKASGGYDGQNKNGRSDNHKRERIWFSPHCLSVKPSGQIALF